jgi:hypothetical protein
MRLLLGIFPVRRSYPCAAAFRIAKIAKTKIDLTVKIGFSARLDAFSINATRRCAKFPSLCASFLSIATPNHVEVGPASASGVDLSEEAAMLKTYAAALFALLLIDLSLCRADEDSPPPASIPNGCCSGEACPTPCGCRRGLLGRIRDRFHHSPVCCSTQGACQTGACDPCPCEPSCRRTLLEKLHLRRPSQCTCCQSTCCQGPAIGEAPLQALESPEAPAEDEKQPEQTPTQPAPRTRARLSAAPNPVSVTATQGSATLTWSTGDGSMGQIYVSRNGEAEKLVTQGAEGSARVSWIELGSTYDFTLYAGSEHKQKLAGVRVRAVRTER